MNELSKSQLEQVVSRLNHGVECEMKNINGKMVVNKTKRQLLFKDVDLSNEQIRQILMENPSAKLEFKLENGKVVVVLVHRKQIV